MLVRVLEVLVVLDVFLDLLPELVLEVLRLLLQYKVLLFRGIVLLFVFGGLGNLLSHLLLDLLDLMEVLNLLGLMLNLYLLLGLLMELLGLSDMSHRCNNVIVCTLRRLRVVSWRAQRHRSAIKID